MRLRIFSLTLLLILSTRDGEKCPALLPSCCEGRKEFPFLILLIYSSVKGADDRYFPKSMISDYRVKEVERLRKSATALLADSFDLVDRTYRVRLNSLRSIPFEVGYLVCHIQEEYRRMVDKYNTTMTQKASIYYHEYMLYVEDVEYHYWKLEHLTNMVHEIERKYGMTGKNTLNAEYVDRDFEPTTTPRPWVRLSHPTIHRRTRMKRKDKKDMIAIAQRQTGEATYGTKKRTRWWWPIEYGWEIDYYW